MTQLATRGETWPVACFETRQDQTREGGKEEGGEEKERRAGRGMRTGESHRSKTVAGDPNDACLGNIWILQ